MSTVLDTILSSLLLMPIVDMEQKPQTAHISPPAYQAAAQVKQRNYEGANLTHANFKGSDATGSNFRYARLDYVNFSMASLKDTDLTGASLAYALIQFTDLRGVSGLTAEQLAQACLIQATDEDRLGTVAGFNTQSYQLPEGCKIWEQALR